MTWEKLSENFVLDDEPVDNISQPAIAAALTESLELAGRLQRAEQEHQRAEQEYQRAEQEHQWAKRRVLNPMSKGVG
jgi:FlaA1/EpsC-like NDP-sugar epimerase